MNWRLIRWLRKRHRWSWAQFRRQFTTPTGRWPPIGSDGVTVFNPAAVTVTRYRYRYRYRYRGEKIPNSFLRPHHA